MGCCSSSNPAETGESDGQTRDAATQVKKKNSRKDLLEKKSSQLQIPNTKKVTSVSLTDGNHQRTKTQEEEERHARQLSYLDKVYREKRITEQKDKEAKLDKLNSDRSERMEKQWVAREKTKHFTARELFFKMCKLHPYDPYKYEQYFKKFYEEDDDDIALGTAASMDPDEDDDDMETELWIPKDGNKDELLDKDAFFTALEELLLPVPTVEEFHKNLDRTKIKEKDIKNMENEIEKQRTILWKFFIYTPEELVTNMRESEIKSYMTYDDFSTGLSALISATVDWRSKAHKLISDALFQIMDHDRDGYLDYHDITALLLSLHKMYGAVFNYEAETTVSREDVEERSTALLGMDWGPTKVDQPVQYLNKRQFAHLFGELSEKHLKDLDLDNILDQLNDPTSPRSPRSLR